MSDESRAARADSVLVEHYCDHTNANGARCPKWGCYGFEESRTITLWYCAEHQPRSYRGTPRHGEARLAAAEIANMLK